MINKMQWYYAMDGQWELRSAMHDQGCPFIWLINVQEDGTFSIANSDRELTDWNVPFNTLGDAKAFCESREDEFCNGAK